MENSEKSKISLRVGQRLREVRRKLGFRRQDAFGQALGGCTADQVGRAERGANLPPPEMIVGLAALGVDLNWLITGQGTIFNEAAGRAASPLAGDLEAVLRLVETLRDAPEAADSIRKILTDVQEANP